MNKEQAVTYLRFSGFSEEQIKAIEGAFTCEDAISRKAVLNTLENMDKALDEDRTVENYKKLLRECYKVLPSVKKPKTGHWVFDEVLDRHYYCSECKSMGVDYWDYCPNCGAKMVEEDKA